MQFLGHNLCNYLEIGVWLFSPDLLDGLYAIRLEVVVQRGDELFAQLVPGTLRSAGGVAALARLPRLFQPLVFLGCRFTVSHVVSLKRRMQAPCLCIAGLESMLCLDSRCVHCAKRHQRREKCGDHVSVP